MDHLPVAPDEPAAPDHSWPAVRSRLATLWAAARLVLGVLLIVVGAIGTLLPVLPGIPLMIAGVALLGTEHWLVKPFHDRLQRWRGQTPSEPPPSD